MSAFPRLMGDDIATKRTKLNKGLMTEMRALFQIGIDECSCKKFIPSDTDITVKQTVTSN
jgi:hypothetical protein